jgi:hypothetical protein
VAPRLCAALGLRPVSRTANEQYFAAVQNSYLKVIMLSYRDAATAVIWLKTHSQR